MNITSMLVDLDFNETRPAIKAIMETDFSKEIRILFRKGHVMKQHQAPYPIVVEIFEGEIDFGVNRETHSLKRGDIINLDAGVPHDLTAIQESIVRLTLSKNDNVNRVNEVVDSKK